ncbi:hypothetical protein GCM10020256_08780 [Streptomyces thermocoprophilus]
MLAAEVLPDSVTSRATTALTAPIRAASGSMMRRLAWCRTTAARSSGGDAGAFAGLPGERRQPGGGPAVHRLAFLREAGGLALDAYGVPHLGHGPPQHGPDAGFGAVGAGLDDGGARAVADEDAGGAVGPVGDGGHLVGADDEGAAGGAGADGVVGGGEGVGEAGAHHVDVHGGGARHAEPGGDAGGGVRGAVDGGGGGHQDQVDVVGG